MVVYQVKVSLYPDFDHSIPFLDQYFDFIENIVAKYDSLVDYQLSEFILIRNNPWVIDLFTETDYYFQKQKNAVVYDQRNLNIFYPGDILLIPTFNKANELLDFKNNLLLDVNIPEYRLNILSGDYQIHSFSIRVGRNSTKFLQTAGPDGREED